MANREGTRSVILIGMGRFKLGDIYRYGQNKDLGIELIDGLPNFFQLAGLKGQSLPLMEKGISQIAPIRSIGETYRYPVILISSSPHNSGSDWNPWHDIYEPDSGYVRYFGDAKGPGDPSLSPGNKLLLTEFEKHSSGNPADRLGATPFVFLKE